MHDTLGCLIGWFRAIMVHGSRFRVQGEWFKFDINGELGRW